jgi:hypothetical protein
MALRNTLRRTLTVASVFLIAACQDAPTSGPTPNAAMSGQAQDRIEAIFQNTSPEVMAIPGTVFSDNDEVVGKVVIGVEHAQAANAVKAQMARLGVSSDDYAIEYTAPIKQMATLRDKFRPTIAGIQIHYSNYVCSIGFNGDDNGERSMYTASHCTATQGGVESTKYYQSSSTIDPTVIATEVEDPAYVKGGAGCPRGKKCRWSDASRALYSGAVASTRGEIAKTTGVNTTSLTFAGVFTVTSQDDQTTNFPVGTTINKVGRTTGWSQGPVSRSCVNSSVSGSTVYLFCQTFVTANVAGGDSGSDVFRITSGDNVQLVGILWGGASDNSYFVFSPLANVVKELGPTVATK